MYKVPTMTQEEAFLLFMQGHEPQILEQIGFHIERDLGRTTLMAEKADVCRAKAKGTK